MTGTSIEPTSLEAKILDEGGCDELEEGSDEDRITTYDRRFNEIFHQSITYDTGKEKWRLYAYILPESGVSENESVSLHPSLKKALDEADSLRSQAEGEAYDAFMREMGGV